MQQMINEMNILSTTAMGTLETVKLIPGYDRAIEFLKKKLKNRKRKTKMELSNKILSDITVYMKYAKFVPELNRRETWVELVDRNKGYAY